MPSRARSAGDTVTIGAPVAGAACVMPLMVAWPPASARCAGGGWGRRQPAAWPPRGRRASRCESGSWHPHLFCRSGVGPPDQAVHFGDGRAVRGLVAVYVVLELEQGHLGLEHGLE